MLGELINVLAKAILNYFERSWQSGKVSVHWKKANVTSVFKNKMKETEKFILVSFTLALGRHWSK